MPELKGTTCQHCGEGVLGKLSYVHSRRGWNHRCSLKKCQKFTKPHDFHPIFFSGAGSSITPLRDQAAILLCAVTGVNQQAAHLLLDRDHKPGERIYANNETARKIFVEMKEKEIKFGGEKYWVDVEADKVDLGKSDDPDAPANCSTTWEQWGGIMQRGASHTLLLVRLNPIITKRRSPGPGPITKREWAPLARKHLMNRNVILHIDGAKAYKMKVPGMLRDNVVHQKKKVIVNGKSCWLRPIYSKVTTHKLSNGKKLQVKAGTQLIDGFWKILKRYLGNSPKKPASKALLRKVRSAQWAYWFQSQNLWQKTGDMLSSLRESSV